MTQIMTPTVNMARLVSEYAWNSSNIMPPETIVPTMIMDCDEGTAFNDGYKLSK